MAFTGESVRFTNDAFSVTLVFFLVIIVFMTGLTEIGAIEEASDARDGMIMIVVD